MQNDWYGGLQNNISAEKPQIGLIKLVDNRNDHKGLIKLTLSTGLIKLIRIT